MISALPALMVSTPQNENKKGVQEVAQNILGVQEVAQNLEALGYLESSQESEIENISETQVVDSSVVYGVLPGELEVHLTGIEPVTFGFVDRCSIQLSYKCNFSNDLNIGQKSPEVNAVGLYICMKPAVNA